MARRLLRVFVGIVALVVALLGAQYWQDNYLSGITLVSLPVPKNDIPPYTIVTENLFEKQDFPRALVSGDVQYFLESSDLTGKITTSVLLSGQPVSVRLAVSPDEFRLADPSLEVASFPISLVNGVGGQVQIGELINIYRLGVRELETQEDDGAFGESDQAGEGALASSDAVGDGSAQDDTPADDDVDQVDSGGTDFLDTDQAEVTLVATVPVVAVLADNGKTAFQGDEPRPMSILVIAAPSDIVQEILGAIALAESGEDMLWITLAEPLDDTQ